MRLRWQLTLSHLAAVAVTLVSMIAAIVLLVTLFIFPRFNTADQPLAFARTVAGSLGDLVGQANGEQLDGALRVLASSNTARSFGPAFGRPPQFGGAIQDLSYIVLIGPDGQELASSDPAGAGFAPSELGEWAVLAARALAGDTSSAELMAPRSGAGPAALTAYPVLNAGGQPVAAVVVAVSSLPHASSGFGFSQALAFFGAASLFVLLAASVFALVSSSAVAYLLARRVVRRLERLGQAAEALAAGAAGARIDDPGDDELGHLAHRFNQMSADLQRSLNQLREERDRVTGLLKARRELVASVSHELRTPVATARGYLESVLRRRSDLPEALRADVQTVEAEIGRLQRLIDDLFTLSRAEAGRLELRLEPTDLGAVVQRAVDTLAPLAWKQWRVQVVVEVPGALEPAQADAERLQQVLSNLLSNAIRHTPPGGLVAVSVDAEDSRLRLNVRDTGPGIAAEDLPHIFERFYRGRGEADTEGAGLGLAVAKELVDAMGGDVQVASASGEGTCFTVTLATAGVRV
ncbi:MAG TPA: ATP-binding protein [Chloroflexota bacterium]